MRNHTFDDLHELVSGGQVTVVEVGAFWRQARLVHRPSPDHDLISVPVTLHLVGSIGAVVYAEMPVETGLQARDVNSAARSSWLKNPFQERPKAALLRFSVPELKLAWHGEESDVHALALAKLFGIILLQEFPDAREQLSRSFNMDLPTLIQHLSRLLSTETVQQDTRK